MKKTQQSPALPFTEIEVDGQKYKMVFTYGALAAAEDGLRARGYNINILVPLLSRTFSSIRTLFAASLYAYQPELEPSETQDWVTPENLVEIIQAVDKAWNKAMPETADPQEPEA